MAHQRLREAGQLRRKPSVAGRPGGDHEALGRHDVTVGELQLEAAQSAPDMDDDDRKPVVASDSSQI